MNIAGVIAMLQLLMVPIGMAGGAVLGWYEDKWFRTRSTKIAARVIGVLFLVWPQFLWLGEL